jgi:hypothetical protein
MSCGYRNNIIQAPHQFRFFTVSLLDTPYSGVLGTVQKVRKIQIGCIIVFGDEDKAKRNFNFFTFSM